MTYGTGNKHTQAQVMVTIDMNYESKNEICKDSHLAKEVTFLVEESMDEQGKFSLTSSKKL